MKIPCKGESPNLINIDQLPIRKQLIKLILVGIAQRTMQLWHRNPEQILI